jgi:plastocyanin
VFVLIFALTPAASAIAGGWAVVELTRPVPAVVVDTPAVIQFRVLQHAEPDHALKGATPVVTLKHRESKAVTRITATAMKDDPSLYESTLLLDEAGEYKWNIAAESFPATAMPTLRVFASVEEAKAFEEESAADSDVVEISILDSAFSSATLEIPAGTTVRWTNTSPMPHQVAWNDLALDDSPLLAQDATYQMTFDQPGTHTYFCGPHPYMVGKIVVTDDPAPTPTP